MCGEAMDGRASLGDRSRSSKSCRSLCDVILISPVLFLYPCRPPHALNAFAPSGERKHGGTPTQGCRNPGADAADSQSQQSGWARCPPAPSQVFPRGIDLGFRVWILAIFLILAPSPGRCNRTSLIFATLLLRYFPVFCSLLLPLCSLLHFLPSPPALLPLFLLYSSASCRRQRPAHGDDNYM